MPEDVKMIPLVEAVEKVTGRSVHLSTAIRWAQRGCGGIKLASWVVGGRRLTTAKAVREFVAQRTAASDKSRPHSHQGDRTAEQRNREVSAAEKRLEQAVA